MQSSRKMALVILMVAVGAGAGAPLMAQNLVLNAEFDADASSWETLGDTVVLVHRPTQGSDLEDGSGPGCLEVQYFFWSGGAGGAQQDVNGITPGASYQVGWSHFLPSADNVADGVWLSIDWLDADGRSISDGWISGGPLEWDTWERASATLVAPAGAVGVRVHLRVGNPTLEGETRPGVALFDDIWMSEQGAATATQVLFVPAAASAQGAAGTFWSTNGWFSNLVEFPVTISGALLRQGQDNSQALTELTELGTIPPLGYLTVTDMVAAVGGSEVSGGLYLEASAAAAGLPATLVAATTYTFTPNPGGDGGYGQGLPVVVAGTKNLVVVPGATQGATHRTNAGLLNTSSQTISVEISVRSATGAQVGADMWTLQPYEQRQASLPSLGVSSLDGGTVVFTLRSKAGSFRAYTSVVDQFTGDAAYTEAR